MMMVMMMIMIVTRTAITTTTTTTIIIIIIIIVFKGAQVAREQSCANHVQHKRLSRATCRVACHVVRRDSSAIKFDRV